MVSGPLAQSTPTPIIYTLVFIIIIVAFRFRQRIKGIKVGRSRAIAFVVALVALSSFIVAGSFSVGIPILFAIPYAGDLVGSAYIGYMYSKGSLVFWKDAASGSIYVKGGVGIFVIYIAALITRLMISAFFGSSTGFSPSFFDNTASTTPLTSVNSSIYLASIVTDFLLMFGAGLFVGRNVRVLKHYSKIQEGKESISEG